MQRGASHEKFGAGLADFCAQKNEAQVIRGDVLASEFKAMCRCHGETNAVAVQAVGETFFHFGR
jgi:hypothetical protein